MTEAPADEGGDPACWLDQVCPECGAVVEDGPAELHCRVDPRDEGELDNERP